MEGQPPTDVTKAPPPLAGRSDKLTLSTSRVVRTGVLAVVLAFGLVLALVLMNEVTRRDTPEDYAKLCQILLEPAVVVNPLQIQRSNAELEIARRRLLADLPRISRRCRKLSPLAQEVVTIERKYEQLSKGFPNLASGVLGVGEALAGFVTEQRGIAADGAQRALRELAKAAEVAPELRELWVQRHVAAVELAELAPQFSAPPTQGAPLGVRFGEHSTLGLGIDTIEAAILTNSSGRELRNCVIELRTYDPKGNSYLRIHFARTWPANETLAVLYSSTEPGVAKFDAIAGVAIRVLSADLSTGWAHQARPPKGWPKY